MKVFDSSGNEKVAAVPTAAGILSVGGVVIPAKTATYISPLGGQANAAIFAEGDMRLIPIFLPPHTWDRLGHEITIVGTAGAVVRLGVYYDTGNGFPGALAIDSGVDKTSGTGLIDGTSATAQSIPISKTLAGGLYWIGAATQGGAGTRPTCRALVCQTMLTPNGALGTNNAPIGFAQQTSVTGALPNPFAGTLASATAQHVEIRAL